MFAVKFIMSKLPKKRYDLNKMIGRYFLFLPKCILLINLPNKTQWIKQPFFSMCTSAHQNPVDQKMAQPTSICNATIAL